MVQSVQLPRSRVQAFAGEVKPVALALSLAFGLGVGTVPAASAATITVNNLSGTSVVGQCTLRDAIKAANTDAVVQGCAAGSGADTINFSLSGQILLPTPIVINSDVTINGTGVTLKPSATSHYSALYIGIGSGTQVTISGVTFQGNGLATVQGAAILHYGAGTLTIQNSVFSGNVTTSAGGALYNDGGDLVIKSSTFTGNRAGGRGGAIFMYSGNLSIDASTLSGNQSTTDGGAIAFYQDGGTTGALTITNSTLSGNSAGSVGGGIFMAKTLASSITNSTISGNTATSAGGGVVLISSAPLRIGNSTVSGNTAGLSGGGILIYTTTGTLNLVSTIVANNTAESAGDIFGAAGASVNGTNSLVQTTSGFSFTTNVNNITGQNPLLGPLANNGGPTLTQALLPGSPAIDKGSNPQALAFDQRGTPFARSNGQTDIGAFEVQGAPPPPPPATSVPVPTLSQWSLALLSAMMAGGAMLTGFGRRRRK